jgi:hypothetical protein
VKELLITTLFALAEEAQFYRENCISVLTREEYVLENEYTAIKVFSKKRRYTNGKTD